ncbi:MAG: FkbM family methyltransferase, partial [Actinomycetota bacterium]
MAVVAWNAMLPRFLKAVHLPAAVVFIRLDSLDHELIGLESSSVTPVSEGTTVVLRKFASRALGPSQMDEVRMLRTLIGRPAGTMLDVGAHQGDSLDPFIECGWRAYAFEPDPSNRSVLINRCPTVTVDPRAVAEVDGLELPLYTSEVSTGISTLSPFHPSHTQTATAKTVRLDSYIRENRIERVDFLKTDIEGWDLTALRTFPWNTHNPRAVICEFEDNKTSLIGYDYHDIARYLQERGYFVFVSEWWPVVQYGAQHRWRRFVPYPVELATNSWGNLIAVNPALQRGLERQAAAVARRLRLRQAVDRLRGFEP